MQDFRSAGVSPAFVDIGEGRKIAVVTAALRKTYS